MPPQAWEAAFNAGQALSRDQAIALALEEVSEAQPFAPAAAERPVDNRLQQYIPKELLAKLEAIRSGRKLEGERRIVTLLFCDVKGSTAHGRFARSGRVGGHHERRVRVFDQADLSL